MASDSQKQEKKWAKMVGGTVNAGSGNTTGHKNDVREPLPDISDSFYSTSTELKTTRNKSYNLRLDDLRNAEKEAILDGREFLFGIQFITGPRAFDYVVMPAWFFEEMRATIESYEYQRNCEFCMGMGPQDGPTS